MARALVVMLSVLFPLVPVHVGPARGGPHTRFTVSLRVPAATGPASGVRRTDAVWVTGPRRSGCLSVAQGTLPVAAAHQLVRVRLAPGIGQRWCAGTFRGVVTQTISVVCGPPREFACPMVMIAPQTIGRFRFHVATR